MVKKLLAICLFAFLAIPNTAKAYQFIQGVYPQTDWMTATRYKNGVVTTTFRIDFFGDIAPGENNANDIGAATVAYKTIYVNSISVASGIVNVHEHFLQLPSTNSSQYNVPNFSAGMSGAGAAFVISTNALNVFTSSTVALPGLFGVYPSSAYPVNISTSYVIADIVQASGPPRNVVMYSTVAFGVATTTLQGYATFYGIDNFGRSNSELIAFSTTLPPGTTAMWSSYFVGVGSVCWSYISSVTITLSSASPFISQSTAGVYIGVGFKVGLANVITSTADIYKVMEGTTSIQNSAITVDTLNGNVTFVNQPNNVQSYDIWCKIRKSTP